jgi:hypothetical protein
MMNLAVYDDRGIRFEYPGDWELDVAEDGSRTTVSVQAESGLAFALVTVDEGEADPDEMVAEALAALKAEYPTLDAEPAEEAIDGHRAVGHDVEFVSLDLSVACSLRGFRTPNRTVFVLTQWSDLESVEADDALRALRRSIEETDS